MHVDKTSVADPEPNFFSYGEKKILKIFIFFPKVLKKRVMCNFLSDNAGGGATDKG